jgi:hypothetical protein
MATITPANFRSSFPEFCDPGKYPNQLIEFWAKIAKDVVADDKFGDTAEEVTELFIAHNLVLQSQSRTAAAAGGAPGGSSGVISSKSVGSVSVSYDTTAGSERNAGHFNQTVYGRQFIYLSRLYGAGAVQI